MIEFLGHPYAYWMELEKRLQEKDGPRMVDLLDEISRLKGQNAFCRTRVDEIKRILGDK